MLGLQRAIWGLAFVALFGAASGRVAAQSLRLSELVAAGPGLADERGDLWDWVEIENATFRSIDLTGYGLSDRRDKVRFRFPDGSSLGAGEFLTVLASGGEVSEPSDVELHAGFSLASSGELLILTAPDGTLVDAIRYPRQRRTYSYARGPTGVWEHQVVPTPGGDSTGPAFADLPELPRFDPPAGVYASPQRVDVSAELPGGVQRYTLDGSLPTSESPEFPGSLRIDRSLVLRLATYVGGQLIGEV
ncbi:MAG: lamin tail domain-containing protein, partial [Planctomycetota bacterium]